ncbi:MAG: hypothetical protein PHE52_02265 [Candidatus Pacebacteria bacterium]|nr:hypothetical protein [Candidatus Paceibacterota bacterium]
MLKSKNILKGFLGGVSGGMVVDLIYITFAGPSGLFTLLGITERSEVFWSHAFLGGILGILFAMILNKLPNFNIWLAGIFYGLACLALIGAIPSFIVKLTITPLTIIFGFIVWILFGLILAATLKFTDR